MSQPLFSLRVCPGKMKPDGQQDADFCIFICLICHSALFLGIFCKHGQSLAHSWRITSSANVCEEIQDTSQTRAKGSSLGLSHNFNPESSASPERMQQWRAGAGDKKRLVITEFWVPYGRSHPNLPRWLTGARLLPFLVPKGLARACAHSQRGLKDLVGLLRSLKILSKLRKFFQWKQI